jgi:hypothetical protein
VLPAPGVTALPVQLDPHIGGCGGPSLRGCHHGDRVEDVCDVECVGARVIIIGANHVGARGALRHVQTAACDRIHQPTALQLPHSLRDTGISR